MGNKGGGKRERKGRRRGREGGKKGKTGDGEGLRCLCTLALFKDQKTKEANSAITLKKKSYSSPWLSGVMLTRNDR